MGIFFTLSSGIKIDNFSFAGVNISQLYIKLDKKLIVNIKKIEIPMLAETTNSSQNVDLYVKNIPLLLTVFESVNIDSLRIGENEFVLKIDKSMFYIDNNQINLVAFPIIKEKEIELEILSLYSKKKEILLNGVLNINLANDIVNFKGKGSYKDLEFILDTITQNDIIDFNFRISNNFKSLSYVKDFIRLHKNIEEWMYDNVKGEITLKNLKGKVDAKTLVPILSSLKGEALVKNAKVKFNKNLNVVTSPLIKVEFKNDNLYFTLKDPKYKNISIDGSKVTIYALTSQSRPANIVVDIATKSSLNNDVLNLIKAYGIKLPVKQLSGSTNSNFSLQVFFKSREIKTKGVFIAENSLFSLNGFEFLAKNAKVELEDEIVKILDSNVAVDGLLQGNLNLNIDTLNKSATGEAIIDNLKVSAKEFDLINIDDFFTTIQVDYTDTTKIGFKELYTDLFIQNGFTEIVVNNLKFGNKYSQLLKDLSIEDGDLNVKIYNKNKINFDANLKNLTLPLYKKDGKQLKEISIKGNSTQNNVVVNSKDNNLGIIINKNSQIVKIKDLDIKNITEYTDTTNNNTQKLNLKVYGKNSDIIISKDGTKIKANSFTINLKDGKKDAEILSKNGIFSYFENEKGEIQIEAKKLDDEFINNLIGVKGLFKGGNFNLVASGTKKLINGELTVDKTKIKDLAIINNLVAFLNTAPAAINPFFAIPAAIGIISNGGFDVTSYKINSGNLKFAYNFQNNNFLIEKFEIIGDIVNLQGFGVIDVENKKINSEVSVAFLKSYSNVVKYIPVVNYLLLGDDDKISTRVKIIGDLNNPKIETNLARDAVTGTFDFFKRIFLLPKKGVEALTPK